MEEPTDIKTQDEDRLAQLGYKQELQRDWSMLHNFGVSFSIIVSNQELSLVLLFPIDAERGCIHSLACLFVL